jgi:TPR repeat protein
MGNGNLESSPQALMERYFSLIDEETGDIPGDKREEAVLCLKQAAGARFPEAEAELGACYYSGDMVPQDLKLAEWLLESAALGDAPNAQMNLYVLQWRSAQTEEAQHNALFWLKKAAEKKVPSALYETGLLHYHALVYPQDYGAAFRYFAEAAEAGNCEAMASLGAMYQAGTGVEKDAEKAAELYAEAARMGSITGLFNMGNAYMLGIGTEQDYEEAIACFEMLTDLDDPFFNPDIRDRATRNDIALLWRQKEAYDMVYPQAHHNLGVMHAEGLGVEADPEQALYHFMLAAENNFAPSCIQAGKMLYLGEGRENADNTEGDSEKAFAYLTIASEAGHADAKIFLGAMYYTGEGTEQDKTKGLALLDELIGNGNAEAQKLKNNLLGVE